MRPALRHASLGSTSPHSITTKAASVTLSGILQSTGQIAVQAGMNVDRSFRQPRAQMRFNGRLQK